MLAWCVVALVAAGSPSDWKQVVDGDVNVYTRDHPGDRVDEVRATMLMRATPAQIRAVLEDDGYVSHQPHIVEFRTIRHAAPNVWDQYGRLKFPMIKDRDYFIEVTREKDLRPDGTGSYRSSWKPWGLERPSRQNIVRVKRTSGSWDVKPVGDGTRSMVEYVLLADPGGAVPGWAANVANKKVVPDVLRSLEREAMGRPKPRR